MVERAHPAEAWSPQSGPQIAFATTEADIAIIGGSPGGGKTVVCLYEGAKLALLDHVRRSRATYFRRTEVALVRGGSVWDRAQQMLPAFGGTVRLEEKSITFEASTAQIEDQHRLDFRHLHLLGSERSYDGSEQDLVVFEELQEFAAQQFWYMVSRMRSRTGVRPRMRGSCNPEPDSWLAELLFSGGYVSEIDGYAIPEMSGVVRWIVRDEQTDDLLWYDSHELALAAHPDLEARDLISFTFILSRLSDNPKLGESDPGYRGRLRVQLRKDRVRLIGEGDLNRGGCWLTTDVAGDFFAADAIKVARMPPSPVTRWVRGWDFGSSEPSAHEPNPDWTEGAKVGLCEGGELWIDDLKSVQLGPIATTDIVREVGYRDGPLVEVGIFQDTGAAGKRDAATLKAELEDDRLTVHVVHSDRRLGDEKGDAYVARSKKKTKSSTAKQALARPWALLASQGRVFMREGEWNKKLRAQAHRFPNAAKDDVIDAISCAVQVLDIGSYSMISAMKEVGR